MKRFKTILTIIRIVTLLLFVADGWFMTSLYITIKRRYLDDVEQCLRRADLIELIDRLVENGKGGEDGIVELWLGLQKSDVGAASTPEELAGAGYSQGYKRMDRQLISVVTEYLHSTYGDEGVLNRDLLEDAFRRELLFSGFNPERVEIYEPHEVPRNVAGLWELHHEVDGTPIYTAYISPLSRNVFAEMAGVGLVTVAIALVFTFSFWYLLHVIERQRTLEEMKDDFTNNMTHELKTPIAIAYAANDALLQFPDPADTARTRRYLEAALQQLTKLNSLVETILSTSMERRKNMALNLEAVNMRELFDQIVAQSEIKAPKPCRITVDCANDLEVTADRAHLTNIVNNLVDNSVKYSGDSVDILIKADRSGMLVSDDGDGIPAGSLEAIFDKFYRVPGGNGRAASGYGIGLYYVKSIVEKHGWSIWAESRLGRGSTFIIRFAEK